MKKIQKKTEKKINLSYQILCKAKNIKHCCIPRSFDVDSLPWHKHRYRYNHVTLGDTITLEVQKDHLRSMPQLYDLRLSFDRICYKIRLREVTKLKVFETTKICFVANLKEVSNVNNQTMLNRFNIEPLVIMHNLKATTLILKQDCEERNICMLIGTFHGFQVVSF